MASSKWLRRRKLPRQVRDENRSLAGTVGVSAGLRRSRRWRSLLAQPSLWYASQRGGLHLGDGLGSESESRYRLQGWAQTAGVGDPPHKVLPEPPAQPVARPFSARIVWHTAGM